MAEIKGFPTCKHIKTDGQQCGSPALSGRNFCYYHTLYRQRNKPNKKTPRTLHAPMVDAEDHWHNIEVMDPFGKRYTLGPLEDGPSLQVAISTVVNALADNRIDITRASTLLYGLQLASNNLRTFGSETPSQSSKPPVTPSISRRNLHRSSSGTGT